MTKGSYTHSLIVLQVRDRLYIVVHQLEKKTGGPGETTHKRAGMLERKKKSTKIV